MTLVDNLGTHVCIISRRLYFVFMFQVKLVNISSNDIVDGNSKLILGLVWRIILHWQVSRVPNT